MQHWRSAWSGLGGADLVGGVLGAATYSAGHHGVVISPPMVFFYVLALLGAYLWAAGLWDWPLPGRKRMQMRAHEEHSADRFDRLDDRARTNDLRRSMDRLTDELHRHRLE